MKERLGRRKGRLLPAVPVLCKGRPVQMAVEAAVGVVQQSWLQQEQ